MIKIMKRQQQIEFHQSQLKKKNFLFNLDNEIDRMIFEILKTQYNNRIMDYGKINGFIIVYGFELEEFENDLKNLNHYYKKLKPLLVI